MNKWLGLCPALFALTFTLTSMSVMAADCSSKVDVPDRPTLSGYSDANAFVADIVSYKDKQAQQAVHQQQCPDLYDNSVPEEPPQTLTQAVQTAANSPMPAAQQKPGSSPKTDLPQDQLANTSINTPLSFLDNSQTQPQTLPSLPFDVIEALNSGDISSDKLKDYLSNRLPAEDQATNRVFQLALAGNNQLAGMTVAGNLNLYTNKNGDITLIDGVIRAESCLSSGCSLDPDTGQLILPPAWH